MRKQYFINSQAISNTFKTFVAIFIIFLSHQATAQTRYYVDSTAGNDANVGTSWGTAYRNISKAMVSANSSTAPVVEIWVSHGTYKPTDGIAVLPTDHRDTSFTFYRGNGIGKGLKVYGGFRGTETTILARDTSHHTYLDGDIGGGLHSYHVVVVAGLARTADSVVIDGFSIRSGYRDTVAFTKKFNGIDVTRLWGGGLNMTKDSTSKLVIENCIFRANMADQGGGIIVDSTIATIIDNAFYENYGTGYSGGGGGIYNLSSAPVILHCFFWGNKGLGSAGAIYNSYSSPLISKCVFDSNIVLGSDYAYGGAICNYSSSPSISNCTFHLNGSGAPMNLRGGAIYNYGGSAPAIDSCNFVSNILSPRSNGSTYGGAVYNEASSPTITRCIFRNNKVKCRDGSSGPGSSYGGAIYNTGGTPVIASCAFYSNTAMGYAYGGGNGYAYGGAICNVSSSPRIASCTFMGDTAIGFREVTTFGSHGYSYGGSIYNYSSFPLVKKCTFNDEAAAGDTHGYGGVMYGEGRSILTVDSCQFIHAYSTDQGGAIFLYYGTLITRNNLFKGNTSGQGGAITMGGGLIGPEASNLACFNNVFAKNKATFNGGGAIFTYMNGGTDSIVNNDFVANKDSSTSGGGAIYNIGSTHYITNNTFYADSSLGRGGAVYGYIGTIRIANNIFYSNYGTATMVDTNLTGAGSILSANNLFSSTNPRFVNSANPPGADGIWGTYDDGLNLQKCSPARNAGSNSYVVPGATVDLTGGPRIQSSIVDMGAYETNPVGLITGAHNLCVGYTELLSDTTAGGVWISQNTAVATISSSGLVTGIAPGRSRILYIVTSSCGTDTVSTFVTVNAVTDAGTITGPSAVCVGATITVVDTVTGGTWSVTNANASISSGVVTGVTAGLDTIKYKNSCGMATTSKTIAIIPLPNAGTITGPSTVCVGEVISLADSRPGGLWHASNANATVSSGVMVGVSGGVVDISYSVTNGCGTAVATKSVTVIGLPDPGSISGPSSVCIGSSVTLLNSVSGGVWGSSSAIATIAGGTVTGASAGVDTIMYAVTNSCGSAMSTYVVTVNPLPPSISAPDTACIGLSVTLTDAETGGTWTSSDNTLATIDLATGSLSGVSSGTVIITYTSATGCVATKSVIVDLCPSSVGEVKRMDIEILPNPAFATLKISSPENIRDVIITSEVGNTIFYNQYNTGNVEIDLKHFSPGIYFVRLNGTLVKRFVKQ